jgi:hypothetical protein
MKEGFKKQISRINMSNSKCNVSSNSTKILDCLNKFFKTRPIIQEESNFDLSIQPILKPNPIKIETNFIMDDSAINSSRYLQKVEKSERSTGLATNT